MGTKSFSVLLALLSCLHVFAHDTFGVRDDLHFSLESRAENIDGSLPIYKNPKASIEDRVNDLLPRMTVEEKVSQMYVHS
jgi:beta-glucosidase